MSPFAQPTLTRKYVSDLIYNKEGALKCEDGKDCPTMADQMCDYMNDCNGNGDCDNNG